MFRAIVGALKNLIEKTVVRSLRTDYRGDRGPSVALPQRIVSGSSRLAFDRAGDASGAPLRAALSVRQEITARSRSSKIAH
jgi:hypothetical protein